MKKSTKKIIEVILELVTCSSMILMGAQNEDGGVCIPWTLCWLAVFAISAFALYRMGAIKEG